MNHGYHESSPWQHVRLSKQWNMDEHSVGCLLLGFTISRG